MDDIDLFIEAVEGTQAVALKEYGVFVAEESAARWLGAGYTIEDAARLAAGE